MKKQLVAIFLMLVMIGTIFIIMPNGMKVQASAGGGNDVGLDNEYIFNITKNLSDIVKTKPKGRDFGTPGEKVAGDYIVELMGELDLYDPTSDLEYPYREQITDKWYPLQYILSGGEKLNSKIEINSKHLTINNLTNGEDVDCFIKAVTNGTREGFVELLPEIKRMRLTSNFTGMNLSIIPHSMLVDPIDSNFVNETFDYVMTHFPFNNSRYLSLAEFIKSRFEDYYNFTFETFDPGDNSTWPSFVNKTCLTEDCVTIKEDPSFNPNFVSYNDSIRSLHPVLDWIYSVSNGFVGECYPEVKAEIRYDYTNESYNTRFSGDSYVPIIYINGSIGNTIIQSLQNYSVTYWLNQTYNNSVISYNVIGQINGTDENKTVIVCSLYDSLWCQGTADSAVGCGTVLAIAKYMNESEITPKYNIKFILFSGEEWGYKGARHYQAIHKGEENITAVIDLNQLGMKRLNEDDPELFLNLITNNVGLKTKVTWINNLTTNYENRTNHNYSIRPMYAPWGTLSNDFAFAFPDLLRDCKTICFLKDFGWYLHHRDGMNHNMGDVMANIDWEDVAVTAELAWNVTKYITVNPDCSFTEGYPQYQTYDGDDENDDPDTVNISFSITSIMPNDKIRVFGAVRSIITTDDDNKDSDGPHDFFEKPEQTSDTPSNPEDILNTISYSYSYLPAPQQTTPCDADTTVQQRISTSQSIITNKTSGTSDLLAVDTSQYAQEHLYEPYSEDYEECCIQKDYWQMEDYIINKSGITDSFSLKIPHYMPDATYNLTVLVFNSTGIIDWKPNLKWFISTNLTPNNDGPFDPDISEQDSNPVPPILQNGIIAQTGVINLTVNASDPNDDDLEVQGAFINADGDVEYTPWTKTFTQGMNHTKQFTWTLLNVTNVRVRTRDAKRGPNQLSNWSDPVNITLNASCYANISPAVEVLSENLTFKGLQYCIENISAWEWDFNDGATNSSQNTSYSYNQTGNYQITLNVTDNESNVYTYNTTITILYIKSDFNMSKNSTKINESIAFTNTSKSYYDNITNLTWDFGDGTILYGNTTPDHNYDTEGIYNVTLTVIDNQSHNHTHTKTVYVDSTPPDILLEPAPTGDIGLGIPVTIYGNFFDNISGVHTATINITYPDGTTGNYSMYTNNSTPFDYEYIVNETWQIGQYFYRLWVVDNANNTNYSTYRSFTISNLFGVPTRGDKRQNITDRLTGSIFTMHENGVADNITAYLQVNQTPSPMVKCHIYQANDSTLIGSTENKTVSTGENPVKIVFNFTGTKPTLHNNTQYIVICWSNTSCNLSYYNVTGNVSRYKTQIYGTPPQSVSFTNETRYYSLYLHYSTKPYINDVSITSETIGFGENVTLSANVSHNTSGVLLVLTEVEYPDNTTLCYIMNNTENDTYQATFEDTWKVGQYNYTLWAYDRLARTNNTSTYNFTVSANATISICTVKNTLTGNDWINLTDPPEQPTNTWQVINRGDTWNQYYNPQENTYRITSSNTPINYKDTSNTYQPINTTLQPQSKTLNTTQYTYGVTRGIYSLYLKQTMNAADTTPAVIIEKNNYLLTQTPPDSLMISYNQTQKISTICVRNTSQITQDGNTALYEHAYQHYNTTDDYAQVSYEYYPTVMKSNLILVDQTAVQDRYTLLRRGLNTDNLWVHYQTQMTAFDQIGNSSLGVLQNDIIYRPYGKNTIVDLWTDESIWFIDQNNTPVFGVPPLYAVDDAGNATLLMKHLHCEPNTDMMILSIYVSLPWLADDNRTYPVSIDPSVVVYAGTGDGYAWQDGSTNWDTVHDGSGSGYSSSSMYAHGIGASCSGTGIYSVTRSFFRFNTSSINDTASIINASVFLHGKLNFPPPTPTPQASGVVFQKWTGGGTISNGDYNDFSGGIYGSLGSWEILYYNELVWENSLSDIDVEGYTDICVREWAHDYNDSAPGFESSYSNYVVYADAPTYKPYINVTYEIPPTSPAVTLISPENYETNISLNPCVELNVTQQEGENVTVQWYQNASGGSWTLFATNVTDGNETVRQDCSWINENGRWYYLKIDAKVGSWPSIQEYYQFYPGIQSKIENTGDTDINGFLVVWLEEYNATSGNWSYLDELYRDATMRRVNSSCSFGIDTVCNGLVNGSMLAGETGGVFRVYTGFFSVFNEVLVCSDDSELVAWWEFEIE